MKYKRKVCVVLFLTLLVVSIAYAFEAYYEIIRMENKVIRLHILANSDSLYDQQLKLDVRNNIINSFSNKFKNITSKKESEKVIKTNLQKIKSIALNTIKQKGYNYDVKVYYDNYEFNERVYDTYTLPEGEYDTVRVEIGEAKGKNWWCVMFPPLCFLDAGKCKNSKENQIINAQVEDKLKEVLTEEEIELIRTKRGCEDIKIKSFLYEIIRKIFKKNTKPK